jgi:hypothetical protein
VENQGQVRLVARFSVLAGGITLLARRCIRERSPRWLGRAGSSFARSHPG